jgi:hypothetical protein
MDMDTELTAHASQCGMCRDMRRGLDPPRVYRQGFDQYGYDRNGIDRYGQSHCDRFGYDVKGYNRYGYNRDGYNEDGYNEDGYDAEGYNEYGDGDQYCEDCDTAPCECATCDYCEERTTSRTTTTLSGSEVCNSCLGDNYSYCEDCDGYYHDDDVNDHDHSDDGCCESPQLNFTIRNDGCEPLANDTRTTITLPAGTISDEGIDQIKLYLHRQGERNLAYDLDKLGDKWQTREGNYAKRLSRHAYKTHQVKLTQDIMSQVGCIARDHSTQVSSEIDVTRDLNQSAEYFYHEDSCWWGGYSESRCALKTNGGFGLRSFSGHSTSGRAWVMPMRLTENGQLTPTFNTMTPDAFVVFNGYGDLSGYAAPRILAHMAGWTYRKISFSCAPMYVNSSGGYLVAPENIADKYTDGSLNLSVTQHAHLFETEKEKELVNA